VVRVDEVVRVCDSILVVAVRQTIEVDDLIEEVVRRRRRLSRSYADGADLEHGVFGATRLVAPLQAAPVELGSARGELERLTRDVSRPPVAIERWI
jgi:hypothetical protein